MGRRTRELILAAVVCGGLAWGLQKPMQRAFVLDPAMRRAVDRQDLQAIRQLALQGADVRMRVIAEGGTNTGPHPPNAPLWLAIYGEDAELLQVLIRCGADVRTPGTDEDTPLMRAAAQGNTKLVEVLLAAGAPVNDRKREGASALLRALEECPTGGGAEYLPVVQMLLHHGADPHVTAPDLTPLALAEEKGLDGLATELRKTGTVGLETCLDRIAAKGPLYAVRSLKLGAVKRLVKQGVSFRVRDEIGTTVMAAVAYRDPELLSYFLKHARGLDRGFLNERCLDGNALSTAASYGNWESAKLLLAAGVDPSVPDVSGRTPLHHAAIEGTGELTNLLIRAGATVDAKDYEGRTPLHFARHNQRGTVVGLLTQAGAR